MDGVGNVWIFAYYQPRISELEVRHPGIDCRDFLRVDLEKDGVDFCVSDCACVGRCGLALLVPDGMSVGKGPRTATKPK